MLIFQLKNNLTKTEIPPIILKIMVHIWKILWSFGFLSWLSTYVFIINSGLNGQIFESVLDILDKFIYDSQNVCGCLTLNKIHFKLVSLIICSICSLTGPPEDKKKILFIVPLIILRTSTETSIYGKFKDKIFNLFHLKLRGA